MAFYNRNNEKKRIAHDFRRQEEEVVRSLCRLGSRPISPRSMQEQEKRIRREIANSNERRRMQSINAGFQFLRSLLPQGEGEKLSKASILQQTADYIYQLEQEKACLLEQNCQLKRVINSQNNQDSDGSSSDSPYPKRKKVDTGDLIDEGIGVPSPSGSESTIEDMKRELNELKYTLEHERGVRIHLEEQVKKLESQLGVPDKAYDIALQDHLSYHSSERKHRFIENVLDKGNRSPKSHMSNVEVDSFHDMSHANSNCGHQFNEVPEDLSGRNGSPVYSCNTNVLVSNTCNIPSLSPHSSPPAFTVELEVTSQQEVYRPSTSRQNLETIVEAIRHLEGDHMFRDDPAPRESPVKQWHDSGKNVEKPLYNKQTSQVHTNQSFSLQHQIIRNAPVSQSRPGVIVSKLS